MSDRDESGSGGFVAGLLVGARLGGGAALLFAPEKGEHLRRRRGRRIRRTAEDAREALEDTASDVRKEVARRRRDLGRSLGV